MRPILLAFLFLTMFTLTSTQEKADGTEIYMGEIVIFAGSFAPYGFAFCEGQLLRVSDYMSLFSILGTKYGGDGITTFGLPNLKEAEKSLNGARYIIALEGMYPPRY